MTTQSTTLNMAALSSATVPRHQVLAAVRALMPPRALEVHEARSIAERQAGRLRNLLDLDGPMVDLDAVASLPRLQVRSQVGLPVSGFSEWSRSRWVIAINGDDHWTRRRFTLAHELKHVLDNPYIEMLYPGRDGTPSGQRAETICDYFAACLLMPRLSVKAAWGQGNQRPDDLAAHFGVSRAAMGLRLHQLGLTSTRGRCGRVGTSSKGRRYERAAPSAFSPSFRLATAQGSPA